MDPPQDPLCRAWGCWGDRWGLESQRDVTEYSVLRNARVKSSPCGAEGGDAVLQSPPEVTDRGDSAEEPGPAGTAEPQPALCVDGAAALVPLPAPALSREWRAAELWKLPQSLSVSKGRYEPPCSPRRDSRGTADPLFLVGTSGSSGAPAKHFPG